MEGRACLQIMPTLVAGGTLVIARPQGHMDPGYVATLIAKHQVTSMIFTVPTLVSGAHDSTAQRGRDRDSWLKLRPAMIHPVLPCACRPTSSCVRPSCPSLTCP